MWRVYESIERIDLESLAPPPSLASRVDLLTFGVGDLSGWIVEAGASHVSGLRSGGAAEPARRQMKRTLTGVLAAGA